MQNRISQNKISSSSIILGFRDKWDKKKRLIKAQADRAVAPKKLSDSLLTYKPILHNSANTIDDHKTSFFAPVEEFTKELAKISSENQNFKQNFMSYYGEDVPEELFERFKYAVNFLPNAKKKQAILSLGNSLHSRMKSEDSKSLIYFL